MKILGYLFSVGSAVGSIFTVVKYLFVKSPEQKETENLQKQVKHENKLDAAMEKAKENDLSDLSKLLSD